MKIGVADSFVAYEKWQVAQGSDVMGLQHDSQLFVYNMPMGLTWSKQWAKVVAFAAVFWKRNLGQLWQLSFEEITEEKITEFVQNYRYININMNRFWKYTRTVEKGQIVRIWTLMASLKVCLFLLSK